MTSDEVRQNGRLIQPIKSLTAEVALYEYCDKLWLVCEGYAYASNMGSATNGTEVPKHHCPVDR